MEENPDKQDSSTPPDWHQLPPEVWCLITNFIEEPKDLSNLLLAGPSLWDPILNASKTTFLFARVLPILTDYLDKQTVLKCRLVSKAWNKYIKNFLSNHPCLLNLDGINHELKKCLRATHVDSSYCWQRSTREVKSWEGIENLLEWLNVSPGANPLITNSFGFHDIPSANLDDLDPPMFWNSLINLLERIGHTIHHFRFQSDRLKTGPVFYRYIRQLLELLPNVKSLRLWFSPHPGHMRVPECEQLIQSNPLPALSQLSVLRVSHVPTVITNAFLRKYSGQLRKVEISSPCRLHHLYNYDNQNLLRPFDNLDEVSVRLWVLNDVWTLQSSGLLGRSLKSLNLFIHLQDQDTLEKCMWVLSNSIAASNLENLLIETWDDPKPGPRKQLIDPQTRLELPELRKLKIICTTTLFNTMDFILAMEALEDLTVIVKNSRFHDQWERRRGYSPKLLNMIGMEELLYESNVWEMMPSLARVRFIYEDEVVDEEYAKEEGVFFDRDTSTYKQKFFYTREIWDGKKNKDGIRPGQVSALMVNQSQ